MIIRPTIQEDIEVFRLILSDWDYIYDVPVMDGAEAFDSWWKREVDYALTALDGKSGEIVGCGYLTDLMEPYSACFHLFKKKGYLNLRMISKICDEAMPLLFDNNNIEKLIAIFPTNRLDVFKMSTMVGMMKDGILRHHWLVNGKWVDCFIMSILRSEVNKWAVGNLLHFQHNLPLQQSMMQK
jgi:RimJ/RimL family protein N-acetyltransferase